MFKTLYSVCVSYRVYRRGRHRELYLVMKQSDLHQKKEMS